MHPVLSRYMNTKDLVDALVRAGKGEPAKDATEAALFAEAKAHPEMRAAVLSSPALSSDETSADVLKLASLAAVRTMTESPTFGPLVNAARSALATEGATPDEAQQLLAMVLLEEGFGGDDDVDDFDEAFVKETLQGFPKLARLDDEAVGALEESFVGAVAPPDRPVRLACTETLFTLAWGDGVGPVTAEQAQEAMTALLDGTSENEVGPRLGAMEALIDHLATAGLVGPLRRQRLSDALHLALAMSAEDAEALDEDADAEGDDDLGDDELGDDDGAIDDGEDLESEDLPEERIDSDDAPPVDETTDASVGVVDDPDDDGDVTNETALPDATPPPPKR